jgi:hypothetical protein
LRWRAQRARHRAINKAPHYCGASRIVGVIAGLTRATAYHLGDVFATDRAVRLERPGIEPGAAGLVKPAVDTIDAPQLRTITHQRRII